METVLKLLGLVKEDTTETFSTMSAILIIMMFVVFGAGVLYVLINSAA